MRPQLGKPRKVEVTNPSYQLIAEALWQAPRPTATFEDAINALVAHAPRGRRVVHRKWRR